ncbi:MAG: acylphosphatase [Cyclonatronaceae bacterium]
MMNTTYPNYASNKYYATPFYLISLEAWRRGLKVTFSKDIKHFRVSSPEKSHFFIRSMQVDPELGVLARKICKFKDETKEYLTKAKVPVPAGRRFFPGSPDEDIIRYAEQIGFPVVIKPTNGYRGEGVFTNLQDVEILKEYLVYLRRELKFGDVIIEEHVQGDDLRIFVLGEEVVAALKRVPANISGNGRDSIEKLIHCKNELRRKNPYLIRWLIKVDSEISSRIKRAGYDFRSVLKEGEILYLRGKCNIASGGDSVDVSDEIPEQVKSTAIEAVKAIPGLNHAGVDIMFCMNKSKSRAVVIEINALAAIGLHHYPSFGKSNDIASALIDHYFPESINAKQQNRLVFYDPIRFMDAMLKNPKVEVTLPALPPEEMVRREITLSGRVQGVGFRRWVEKQAMRMNLSGYVENQGRNSLHIVVAGEAEQVKAFEKLCKTGPDKARIEKISSRDYEEAVIFGFSIIRKDNVLLDKFRRIPKAILRRMVKFKKRINLFSD